MGVDGVHKNHLGLLLKHWALFENHKEKYRSDKGTSGRVPFFNRSVISPDGYMGEKRPRKRLFGHVLICFLQRKNARLLHDVH